MGSMLHEGRSIVAGRWARVWQLARTAWGCRVIGEDGVANALAAVERAEQDTGDSLARMFWSAHGALASVLDRAAAHAGIPVRLRTDQRGLHRTVWRPFMNRIFPRDLVPGAARLNGGIRVGDTSWRGQEPHRSTGCKRQRRARWTRSPGRLPAHISSETGGCSRGDGYGWPPGDLGGKFGRRKLSTVPQAVDQVASH
jgi:hypothetical protein